MGKCLGIHAMVAASMLALAGCGPGGGLDVKAAAEALPVFADPLQITMVLNPDDPVLGGSCLAAHMVQSGALSLRPSVAGPPYWTIDAPNASTDGTVVYAPVGSRKIRSVSERRAWKEGATAFQAATIEYDIINSGPLASSNARFGPFILPFLFENHPAVNQWVLSPQSNVPSVETEVAAVEAAGAASCNLNVLSNAAIEAKRHAFDQMEKNLADTRGIKRTSTPNIVESSAIGRQLYLGTEHVNSLVGLPITAVVPKARELCSSLQAGGHNDWRLGTFADMRAVTDKQVHDILRIPTDLPDRRIWGTFLGSLAGTEQVYMPVADAPSQNWGPFAALAVGSGTRFSENDLVMGFNLQNAYFRLFCVRDS